MNIGITGLSHVAIKASDPEKSVSFYKRMFGLAEHYRLHQKDTGMLRFVCLKINDSQWLEIFNGPTKAETEDLIYQIAFKVDGIEGLRQKLMKAGWEVPPKVNDEVFVGNRSFSTRDPNGYIVEFVEYQPGGRSATARGLHMPGIPCALSIGHVGVVLKKPFEESLSFYGEMPGLIPRPAGERGNRKGTSLGFGSPNGQKFIDIKPSDEDLPHFCLQVADWGRALEYLRKAIDSTQGAASIQMDRDDDGPFVVLRDPDGIRVEIRGGKRPNLDTSR